MVSMYIILEWMVVHLNGLLINFYVTIKQLNFIILILHGDWLEVVYLNVVPGDPCICE